MNTKVWMVVAVAVLFVAGQAQAGLIGHWKLDDGSGTTAADEIDSPSQDGTLFGDPTWVTTGLPSVPSGTTAALDFDGDGDTVSIADAAQWSVLESGDTATIAFWFYARSAGDTHGFTKDAEYGLRFRVEEGDLKMRFDLFGDNSGTGDAISLNEWHHAAVTFTAGTGGTLYLDGEVYKTYSSTETSNNTSNELHIGSRDGGEGFFDGLIDDVRLYDEVLDADDVKALVPEPATMAILALGGIGVLLRRRRS
jgi:hypothetical protein